MSRRFQTGELVDAYRIEGFVGAGGMGEVYLGIHTGLERYAAIKVLNLSSMDSSLSIRFQNEARLQSSLHHPNIATLYDYKQIGDRLLIFMEFVDGESLEDLVGRKFFSVDEALLVFYSIVEAVAFVHSNGVIHRDIKSQNIKLTSAGVPKLLDFGIAKDSKSSKLTRTGGIVGTPNYIAPEQLSGEKPTVSTDIWALGVLLYELLTGNMPFQADNLGALCDQIRIGEFYPIEVSNSAVPDSVINIAEKCLESDPTKRYHEASNISADVARVLKSHYGINPHPTDANKSKFYSAEDNYSSAAKPRAKQASSTNTSLRLFGVASVFIGLVFFGLIVIWAFSGSDQPAEKVKKNKPEPEQTLKTNDLLAVTPDVPPEVKKPDIQIASSTSNGAEKKTVVIDVIQSSADVLLNGETVGQTPYQLTANIGDVINLKLRRQGFADKDIQVEINSRKRVYTYSLKPE